MIQKNPYAAYNNSKIQTATPAELTLLLYDGAIKFANIAAVAIEKGDIEKAHNNIVKAESLKEGNDIMKIIKLIDKATNNVERFFLEKDVKNITAKNGVITLNFKEGGSQSVPMWAYRLEGGKQ